MKIELNKPVVKPKDWDELPVRDKLIEISCLITTLNVMFREVREQIEKTNDNDSNKIN